MKRILSFGVSFKSQPGNSKGESFPYKCFILKSRTSCVSIPVFIKQKRFLKFRPSEIAKYRCCHWIAWSTQAAILLKFHYLLTKITFAFIRAFSFVCWQDGLLYFLSCSKTFSFLLWTGIMLYSYLKWTDHTTLYLCVLLRYTSLLIRLKKTPHESSKT